MSLKAFHILFIILSILLAFGFSAWEAHEYALGGKTSCLLLSVGSLLAGVGLVFYFRAVLKKLKHISYL